MYTLWMSQYIFSMVPFCRWDDSCECRQGNGTNGKMKVQKYMRVPHI